MSSEICLYGTVGADFWEEDYFTEKTVRDQLADASGELTVRINSGGGIASVGMSIYNLLRGYGEPVTVIVDGIAASAASLIAMAGDTIIMGEGALMMIHDPANWFTEGRGTEEDHLRTARALRVSATAYAGVYAKRAGMNRDDARAIMREEVWYGPDEAVEAGFATQSASGEDTATAAAFDYGTYKNAPPALLSASETVAPKAGKRLAVAAIHAAFAASTSKGTTMAKEDLTEDEDMSATDDQDMADTGREADEEPEEDDADTSRDADEEPEEDEEATASSVPVAAQIFDLGQALGAPATMTRALIASGATLATASVEMMKHSSEGNKMSGNAARGGTAARVTEDVREKFVKGATAALTMKTAIGKGERNEFTSMSLSELARRSLEVANVALPQDRLKMIGSAFTMTAGGHTTSDFANVLANVMGKAALKGWEEAEETFEIWTAKGVLTDFKPTKRVGTGVFPSLPKIGEDGEYTYGTVGDRGEEIILATYGKLLRITRQAIINDDLQLFGQLPRKMGRAAKRTVGNLAYGVLTANPRLSDNKTLFHADHKNLATPAGALGVDTFDAGRTAMRTQKDAGEVLNIAPKYLLVPSALELTANQLMLSQVDPRDNKGHAMNPVQNGATVVADARLDAKSNSEWYMTADPNMHDTVEVAYLDGNDTPYLEEQDTWNVDGVEMKVRIDAAAAPMDHRTVYKNAG